MSKPKLITPTSQRTNRKLRVAAYCRVSSSSADQLNSYANQINTYTRYINSNKDWELVDIFADEGISGTSADKRSEFQRMIKMCELKQIDLILAKSMSRFARNTKETIEYTRKLKLIGVGVHFEKESINTLYMADEMLLTVFAAIAQEESQAMSENIRFANRKRMETGEYESVENGLDIESREDEFKSINEQITLLNERIMAIRESVNRNGRLAERLEYIQKTIDQRANACNTYDDTIVRQMIECIKVYKDGKIQIIFGGGYEMEEYLTAN